MTALVLGLIALASKNPVSVALQTDAARERDSTTTAPVDRSSAYNASEVAGRNADCVAADGTKFAITTRGSVITVAFNGATPKRAPRGCERPRNIVLLSKFEPFDRLAISVVKGDRDGTRIIVADADGNTIQTLEAKCSDFCVLMTGTSVVAKEPAQEADPTRSLDQNNLYVSHQPRDPRPGRHDLAIRHARPQGTGRGRLALDGVRGAASDRWSRLYRPASCRERASKEFSPIRRSCSALPTVPVVIRQATPTTISPRLSCQASRSPTSTCTSTCADAAW